MKTHVAKQSIWTLVIIAFLTVAVGATLLLVGKRQEIRHKAAVGAVLELQPNSTQKFLGDDIELNVVVDTGTKFITAADIRIDFDTNYLQGVSISQGSFMPNILVNGSISGGRARIVVGGDTSYTGNNGQGVLATLHLRANNLTNGTNVVFSQDSLVSAFGGGATSVIESTIPSQIKIVNRATADTVLAPTTSSTSVQNGNEFDVNLQINTGANSVTAADLVVNYDPQYLDGISINPGDFLPRVLSGGQMNNGRATIVLGTASDVGAKQGQGTVAILRFRAKSIGSTIVAVDSSSQVSQDQQNMVRQWNQLSLNITNQPTVIPTPAATPNPTPAATPGVGGGGGFGDTPTCTKTAPDAPTNLRGVKNSSNQVVLTWDYSHSAIVTRYSLVYGVQSGNYIYGADNLGITNTYTVGQLNPTTTYYFAVRAYNDCAAVGFSNEVSVRGNVITNGGYVPTAPRARATPYTAPAATPTPLPGFGTMPSEIPFLARPSPTIAPIEALASPSDLTSSASGSGSIWMVLLKAIQDYWWWLLLFLVLIITGIYLNHKRR